MSEAGPQINGPASPTGKYIDHIDPDDPEYIKNLQRPAEVKEDLQQMENRSRVKLVLNSQAFKEELEQVVEEQLRSGPFPASLLALQQITDLLLPHAKGGLASLARASAVIPINDLRGVESLGFAKGEKLLRCKLAALYRLVDLCGWSHGIHNHITVRVSAENEHFLLNPFGLTYSEVTASSLIKVDVTGDVLEPGSTNLGAYKPGFLLHAAIHQARPDIKCIVHLHTPAAVAVSALKCGLLPMSQEALICGNISYHDFQGITVSEEERDKLVRNLGVHNKVLVLRNRGILACGETIEEAFHYTFNVMSACETQVRAIPLGIDNIVIPSEEARQQSHRIASQGGGGVDSKERKWRTGELEFEALMRTLDNSGYRTGYAYKMPVVKQEKKERSNSEVEIPPASSSFTYIFDGDYLHSKYGSPLQAAKERQKNAFRAGWMTSPNAYKKTEIDEIGTTTPKKITKWIPEGDSPNRPGGTPVKIDNPNQFAPQGDNPREFKEKQKSIKKDYYEERVTAGPQSKILEGITWDEVQKVKDGQLNVSGDQLIVVGAASKGIIQRDHQHNAVVYRQYYAANPFENMSEAEIEQYQAEVRRREAGEPEVEEEIPQPSVEVPAPQQPQLPEEPETQETDVVETIQSEVNTNGLLEAHKSQHSSGHDASLEDRLLVDKDIKVTQMFPHDAAQCSQRRQVEPNPVLLNTGFHYSLGSPEICDCLWNLEKKVCYNKIQSENVQQDVYEACIDEAHLQSNSQDSDIRHTENLRCTNDNPWIKNFEEKESAADQEVRWVATEASSSEEDFVSIQLNPIQLYHGQAESGVMKVRFSIQSIVRRRVRSELSRGGSIEEIYSSVSEPFIEHCQTDGGYFQHCQSDESASLGHHLCVDHVNIRKTVKNIKPTVCHTVQMPAQPGSKSEFQDKAATDIFASVELDNSHQRYSESRAYSESKHNSESNHPGAANHTHVVALDPSYHTGSMFGTEDVVRLNEIKETYKQAPNLPHDAGRGGKSTGFAEKKTPESKTIANNSPTVSSDTHYASSWYHNDGSNRQDTAHDNISPPLTSHIIDEEDFLFADEELEDDLVSAKEQELKDFKQPEIHTQGTFYKKDKYKRVVDRKRMPPPPPRPPAHKLKNPKLSCRGGRQRTLQTRPSLSPVKEELGATLEEIEEMEAILEAADDSFEQLLISADDDLLVSPLIDENHHSNHRNVHSFLRQAPMALSEDMNFDETNQPFRCKNNLQFCPSDTIIEEDNDEIKCTFVADGEFSTSTSHMKNKQDYLDKLTSDDNIEINCREVNKHMTEIPRSQADENPETTQENDADGPEVSPLISQVSYPASKWPHVRSNLSLVQEDIDLNMIAKMSNVTENSSTSCVPSGTRDFGDISLLSQIIIPSTADVVLLEEKEYDEANVSLENADINNDMLCDLETESDFDLTEQKKLEKKQDNGGARLVKNIETDIGDIPSSNIETEFDDRPLKNIKTGIDDMPVKNMEIVIDMPTRNIETVIDDIMPTRNIVPVIDDDMSTRKMETVIDDTMPTRSMETVIDDTMPTRSMETVIDDIMPTRNMETVIDDTMPTRNMETIIDDIMPTRSMETVIDDIMPTRNMETVIDDIMPTRNMETVIDDTMPTRNMETVIDDTMPTRNMETVIYDTMPTRNMETVIYDTMPTRNMETYNSSIPNKRIEANIDGVTSTRTMETTISDPRFHRNTNRTTDTIFSHRRLETNIDDSIEDELNGKKMISSFTITNHGNISISGPTRKKTDKLQQKHTLDANEGPIQTSSPKIGRAASRESPFKPYLQKLGKSEETLLAIMPLEGLVPQMSAKSQEEIEKFSGEDRLKWPLSRSRSLGPHHVNRKKQLRASASLHGNRSHRSSNDNIVDKENLRLPKIILDKETLERHNALMKLPSAQRIFRPSIVVHGSSRTTSMSPLPDTTEVPSVSDTEDKQSNKSPSFPRSENKDTKSTAHTVASTGSLTANRKWVPKKKLGRRKGHQDGESLRSAWPGGGRGESVRSVQHGRSEDCGDFSDGKFCERQAGVESVESSESIRRLRDKDKQVKRSGERQHVDRVHGADERELELENNRTRKVDKQYRDRQNDREKTALVNDGRYETRTRDWNGISNKDHERGEEENQQDKTKDKVSAEVIIDANSGLTKYNRLRSKKMHSRRSNLLCLSRKTGESHKGVKEEEAKNHNRFSEHSGEETITEELQHMARDVDCPPEQVGDVSMTRQAASPQTHMRDHGISNSVQRTPHLSTSGMRSDKWKLANDVSTDRQTNKQYHKVQDRHSIYDYEDNGVSNYDESRRWRRGSKRQEQHQAANKMYASHEDSLEQDDHLIEVKGSKKRNNNHISESEVTARSGSGRVEKGRKKQSQQEKDSNESLNRTNGNTMTILDGSRMAADSGNGKASERQSDSEMCKKAMTDRCTENDYKKAERSKRNHKLSQEFGDDENVLTASGRKHASALGNIIGCSSVSTVTCDSQRPGDLENRDIDILNNDEFYHHEIQKDKLNKDRKSQSIKCVPDRKREKNHSRRAVKQTRTSLADKDVIDNVEFAFEKLADSGSKNRLSEDTHRASVSTKRHEPSKIRERSTGVPDTHTFSEDRQVEDDEVEKLLSKSVSSKSRRRFPDKINVQDNEETPTTVVRSPEKQRYAGFVRRTGRGDRKYNPMTDVFVDSSSTVERHSDQSYGESSAGYRNDKCHREPRQSPNHEDLDSGNLGNHIQVNVQECCGEDQQKPSSTSKGIFNLLSCVGGKSSTAHSLSGKQKKPQPMAYYEEDERWKVQKLSRYKDKMGNSLHYFTKSEEYPDSGLPAQENAECLAEDISQDVQPTPLPEVQLSDPPDRNSGSGIYQKRSPLHSHKPSSPPAFPHPTEVVTSVQLVESSDEINDDDAFDRRDHRRITYDDKFRVSQKREANMFSSFGKSNISTSGSRNVSQYSSSKPSAVEQATVAENMPGHTEMLLANTHMETPVTTTEQADNVSNQQLPRSTLAVSVDVDSCLVLPSEADPVGESPEADLSLSAPEYTYQHQTAEQLHCFTPSEDAQNDHSEVHDLHSTDESRSFDLEFEEQGREPRSFDLASEEQGGEPRSLDLDSEEQGRHHKGDSPYDDFQPIQRHISETSVASESVFSLSKSTSSFTNPLIYEPWRAKVKRKKRSHSVNETAYSKVLTRPARAHSIGEVYNSTVATSVARRRARTLHTIEVTSRMYQPRYHSRSHTSLADSSFGSTHPGRQRSFSGFDHSMRCPVDSVTRSDSEYTSESETESCSSPEPDTAAVNVKRSESARESSRCVDIDELEQKSAERSKSERHTKFREELGEDKPVSPSKSDTLKSTDSASGGETLEDRSSKEGSPTKEHPSPVKEKKKKKKFRIPSFSKKKSKESKGSAS